MASGWQSWNLTQAVWFYSPRLIEYTALPHMLDLGKSEDSRRTERNFTETQPFPEYEPAAVYSGWVLSKGAKTQHIELTRGTAQNHKTDELSVGKSVWECVYEFVMNFTKIVYTTKLTNNNKIYFTDYYKSHTAS